MSSEFINNQKVQEAILKTLAYFDIFSQPLTKSEILNFLFFPYKISDESLFYNLDYLVKNKKIELAYNFYFLKGKNENIKKRQLKVKVIEKKLAIMKKALSKISKIPFLRAVFVCNTVAMGVAENNSDIDLFIIAKKNYIWFVRFFTTIFLKASGLRTSKNKHKDKICLSFFAVDSQLNLENLKLEKVIDIYLIYWILNLLPVYDPDNLYLSIRKANKWLDNYVYVSDKHYCLVDYLASTNSNSHKKFWEEKLKKNNFLEFFLRKLQWKKVREHYGFLADMLDSKVVISEDFLKFHENDRRKEYYDKWLNKCQEVL
ncbi:MAG: hypothetical protein WC070_04250 [Candidatus Magasanikbacteria bacterium]